MNDDNTADGCGELGDKNVRPLIFGGHCFFVRTCLPGKQAGSEFWERELDGIALPQTAMDTGVSNHSAIVEVLAKGPKVGKPCTKAHSELHKRPRHIIDLVSIGDLLLCPKLHPTGVLPSGFVEYEHFVEESVPVAIIDEDN